VQGVRPVYETHLPGSLASGSLLAVGARVQTCKDLTALAC
jgi:hypothetical protein